MPKFKVTKHTDSGLRGDVSCLTAEINGQVQTLVSDGGRGFLVCECKVYQGVWQRGEADWIFVPHESAIVAPIDNLEFSILDFYWGERVQLVFEESLSWERQAWTAGGHDHCAICWKTIDASDGSADHYAAEVCDDVRFHSTERSCVDCYETHIHKNDTSFVPAFN